MTSLPLISIIFPVIDDAYHPISFQSLLDQTYSTIEILVVHDGEQKKGLETIQALVDQNKNSQKQIKIIKTEIPGMIGALNTGLEQSLGDYLTVLPTLDYYSPDRIEKLISKMQLFDIHLAFTRVSCIDQNHQPVSINHPWKLRYEAALYSMIETPTIEANFLNENIACSIGNLVFSRKLYEKIGPFRGFIPAEPLKTVWTSFIYSNFLPCLDYILRAIPSFEISFINENLYTLRIIDCKEKTDGPPSYQKELEQIRLDYFLNMSINPPSNRNVPLQDYFDQSYNTQQKLQKNVFPDYPIEKLSKVIPQQDSKDHEIHSTSKSLEPITLVTQELTIGGGTPKLLLDMSKGLIIAGYKPTLFSLNDGDMRQAFEKLGIPVYIIPTWCKWSERKNKWMKGFSLLLMLLYTYWKTSRKVIFNSASTHLFALPFVLLPKNRSLTWYIHESFSPSVYLKSEFERKLLQRALQKNTFSFWFGSESTKKIWYGASEIKGKVFYWSGIKTAASANSTKPIKNLLAVGTVNIRKGTHHLVDAFIECVKKKMIADDVQLTIVGLPSHVDKLVADTFVKIIDLNLQNRIRLVGCVSEDLLEEYYKSCDLFIQTSLVECLPLSLLKAMAEAIPVISTDVNGCSEVIEHEKTGYLCKPFSSKSLASTISVALNNCEKSHDMAREAQKAFNKKFSLDITMHEIVHELKIN
jgi:glycosyltransferase involved in cell wall biosynthesis